MYIIEYFGCTDSRFSCTFYAHNYALCILCTYAYEKNRTDSVHKMYVKNVNGNNQYILCTLLTLHWKRVWNCNRLIVDGDICWPSIHIRIRIWGKICWHWCRTGESMSMTMLTWEMLTMTMTIVMSCCCVCIVGCCCVICV